MSNASRSPSGMWGQSQILILDCLSSGWTAEQLQYEGAIRVAYVLATSGARTGMRFSTSGAHSYTTTHTRGRYAMLSEHAARFDYTVEELQKTGALFWSWLLAGMPPFPVPSGSN